MADNQSNHKDEENEFKTKSQNILKKFSLTLSNCHSCNHHFPPVPKSNTLNNLKPLKSQWRIALLCDPCHHLIQSKSMCSYCFSSFANDANQETFLDCAQCACRVHRDCVPAQQLVVSPLGLDCGLFICVDCCALPTSEDRKVRGLFRIAELKRAEADRANEIAIEKVKAAKTAADRAKEALIKFSVCGTRENKYFDSKLHPIMNGSKRVLKINKINKRSKNGRRLDSCEKEIGSLDTWITYDGSKKIVNDVIGSSSSKSVNHTQENHTLAVWMSHKKAKQSKNNLSETSIGENSPRFKGKGGSIDQITSRYSKKQLNSKEMLNGTNL